MSGQPTTEYPPGRLLKLQSVMDMNPGKVYAEPDGWWGNRPFFDSRKYPDGFFDKTGKRNPDGSRAEVLLDPDGVFGVPDGKMILTPTPSGPVDTRLSPDSTTLPAVTVVLDPKAVIASWGFADQVTGAVSMYDVHRDGTLTPYGSSPDLPPEWALAMSPYDRSQYRSRSGAQATSTTPSNGASTGAGSGGSTSNPSSTSSSGSSSGTAGGAVLSAGGTPITGKASDLFLVNGVTYNGLGQVVQTVTNQTNLESASAQIPPVLVLVGVAAVLLLGRRKRA